MLGNGVLDYVLAIVAVPGDQANEWPYAAALPIGLALYLIYPHRPGAGRG